MYCKTVVYVGLGPDGSDEVRRVTRFGHLGWHALSQAQQRELLRRQDAPLDAAAAAERGRRASRFRRDRDRRLVALRGGTPPPPTPTRPGAAPRAAAAAAAAAAEGAPADGCCGAARGVSLAGGLALRVPLLQVRCPRTAEVEHHLRGRLSAAELRSDMAALKRCNPSAALEDFVRWHMPEAWDADAGRVDAAAAGAAVDGGADALEALWEGAAPRAAKDQPALFDERREAEKVLHELETIGAEALHAQLLCGAIGAAEAALRCAPTLALRIGGVADAVAGASDAAAAALEALAAVESQRMERGAAAAAAAAAAAMMMMMMGAAPQLQRRWTRRCAAWRRRCSAWRRPRCARRGRRRCCTSCRARPSGWSGCWRVWRARRARR